MRLTILLLFLSSICFAQQKSIPKNSEHFGYLEYLPSDYGTTTKTYPAIIFLSGSGPRGTGSTSDLEKLKGEALPKLIQSGQKLCFTIDGVQECFIVLSPQQSTSRWSWEGNEVIPFVQYALRTYRIDPKRVYLTGISMGSDGSWINSYSSYNEPNYFAAIAPISGKGDYKQARITAERKIPVWCFWGENDTAVPKNEAKNPVDGMNIYAPAPEPKWQPIAGKGHNSGMWDYVYNPTNAYFNPNLYQWFLSYSKDAPPPTKDPVVESYLLDGILYIRTNSGKVLKIAYTQ